MGIAVFIELAELEPSLRAALDLQCTWRLFPSPAVQRCSAPHASPPSLSCALVPSDASYSAQRCGSPGDSLPPCILYAAVPGK